MVKFSTKIIMGKSKQIHKIFILLCLKLGSLAAGHCELVSVATVSDLYGGEGFNCSSHHLIDMSVELNKMLEKV